MPRIPGIGPNDAVRVFHKLGYRIARHSGHVITSNGAIRLAVPRHSPINAITMGAIARDAGLTPEQFRELLQLHDAEVTNFHRILDGAGHNARLAVPVSRAITRDRQSAHFLSTA